MNSSMFSNSLSLNKSFISTKSCFNNLPEPIAICHTSEFHICHLGNHTYSSDASRLE
ncbi:MAG: hypothetical protein Q8S84_09430 [bacterium]|nr:hypothetical protein [bacterium]MDP3381640.1 hypothetical protein [bacterium]